MLFCSAPAIAIASSHVQPGAMSDPMDVFNRFCQLKRMTPVIQRLRRGSMADGAWYLREWRVPRPTREPNPGASCSVWGDRNVFSVFSLQSPQCLASCADTVFALAVWGLVPRFGNEGQAITCSISVPGCPIRTVACLN